MPIRKSRIRFVLQLWLLISVACFLWNAFPALARYRAEQQHVLQLESQQQFAPTPVVDFPAESPQPESTIMMTGQVAAADQQDFSAVTSSMIGGQGQLVVVDGVASLVDAETGQLTHCFPESGIEEGIYTAAISGDGKFIMTAGAFTRIQFWDAATGKLLQTIEDTYPTLAAQPDTYPHSKKHINGLSYSDAETRLIAAAPDGCLFAVGKIDGSIEFWAVEDHELPNRINDIVVPDAADRAGETRPAPESFRMLSRCQPHVGRITNLDFTLDCQSLISLSGPTFRGMEELHIEANIPRMMRSAYENDFHPRAVRTVVATGESAWSNDLPGHPAGLALDAGSQNTTGLDHPPRGAFLLNDNAAYVFRLDDGELLQSFSVSVRNLQSNVAAIAFAPNDSCLWTAETRHVGRPGQHSVGSVTAWDILRGQRIATAEIPGQFLSATWDLHGERLATTTWNLELSTSRSKSERAHVPWQYSSVSPFSLHIWDTEIVPRQPPETEKTDTLP